MVPEVVTVEADEVGEAEPLAIMTPQRVEDIPFTESYTSVKGNKIHGQARLSGPLGPLRSG